MLFDKSYVRGVISVAIPSRKRVRGLRRAWDSLVMKANGGVELLVAYDADDPETGEWARDSMQVSEIIEFPERLFWGGNNQYFAALFKRSLGEWILPFGDDGEMLTDNWDDVVRFQRPGVLYLMGGVSGHNVFPIVHRTVLEALAWDVCPSPHQDTWLTDVARDAGILHETNIHAIEHRTLDETRPVDRFQYRTHEYYGSAMTTLRIQDVVALRKVFT